MTVDNSAILLLLYEISLHFANYFFNFQNIKNVQGCLWDLLLAS